MSELFLNNQYFSSFSARENYPTNTETSDYNLYNACKNMLLL